MDIDSEVQKILQEATGLLSAEEVMIAQEFMSHHELHLVIEFICDRLVENDIYVPYELGTKIQKVVDNMGLDPLRTWDSLTVSKDNGREVWMLTPGKDYLELFDEVNEIYQQLKGKIDLEGDGSAHEFLTHGEYALAIEVIYADLKITKTPITRELARKIRTAMVDTGCEYDSLNGIVIKKDE